METKSMENLKIAEQYILSNLLVYYGFSRLTPKVVKKRELAIYFENSSWWKSEEWVSKRMEIVATRYQSKAEAECAGYNNRMFTKYSYMIDDKPFYSDIDKVLQMNYEADKNHASPEKRDEIRFLLKNAFKTSYPGFIKKHKINHLQLDLFVKY